MRPLYCYKRNNGFYYVRFVDPLTKKLTYGRSTHQRDRDAAFLTSYKWLEQVIPTKYTTSKPITQVFSFDTALAHGTSITRRHCYEMTNRVKTYWEPAFGQSITIEELKDEDIEDFLLNQKSSAREIKNTTTGEIEIVTSALSGATIKKILNAIRKPLKWAMKKNIISYDPTASIDTFSSKIKERGILEDSEVQALIALELEYQRRPKDNEERKNPRRGSLAIHQNTLT